MQWKRKNANSMIRIYFLGGINLIISFFQDVYCTRESTYSHLLHWQNISKLSYNVFKQKRITSPYNLILSHELQFVSLSPPCPSLYCVFLLSPHLFLVNLTLKKLNEQMRKLNMSIAWTTLVLFHLILLSIYPIFFLFF